jgi:hypothetical protein
MDASPHSPSDGENVSEESVDWEAVGRAVLSSKLEVSSAKLRETFREVAARVDGGEEIQHGDVCELGDALRDVRYVVDALREGDPVQQEYADVIEEAKE